MTAQAGSASSSSSAAAALPSAAAALTDRQQLRSQMRRQRRLLSPVARAEAHRQFARILNSTSLLRPGRRVAVYFAYGHEADLRYVIEVARRRGCLLYLPVITNFRHSRMRFVRYRIDSVMRVNRYGIAEPDPRHAEVVPVSGCRRSDLAAARLSAGERGTVLRDRSSGAWCFGRSATRIPASTPSRPMFLPKRAKRPRC